MFELSIKLVIVIAIIIFMVCTYACIVASARNDDTAYSGIPIEYSEELGKDKCEWPDGVIIKPDGINELDPCVYEEIETHYNCTVHVLMCKHCGNIELEWEKQEEWIDEDGNTLLDEV